MSSPAHHPAALGRARQLTADWYFGELWGWSTQEQPSAEAHEAFLKALLVCANGDGTLSDEERAWVLGHAAIGGASDALLGELSRYPATDDIEHLVTATSQTNEARAALIYAAVAAASADHVYDEAERCVIERGARALGVPSSEVSAIERLVKQEEQLKRERLRICFPDGSPLSLVRRGQRAFWSESPTPDIGRARTLAASWYYREVWGWQLSDVCSRGGGTFLKALLVCANGDGLLTDAERSWVLGRAAAAGATEALLDELASYPADESLKDVVMRNPTTDRSRRAVVYLAILAARSDQNYSAGERRAIHHAAALLGLDEEEMTALERLIAAESRMRTERVARCLISYTPPRTGTEARAFSR